MKHNVNNKMKRVIGYHTIKIEKDFEWPKQEAQLETKAWFFAQKLKKIRKIPTCRIRTSDLRMALNVPLQSSALPTELRSGCIVWLSSFYNIISNNRDPTGLMKCYDYLFHTIIIVVNIIQNLKQGLSMMEWYRLLDVNTIHQGSKCKKPFFT